MGSSVATCAQPAFASAAGAHPKTADSPQLSEDSTGSASDDESAFEASHRAEVVASESAPEIYRSFAATRQARRGQHAAASQRASVCNLEVDELRTHLGSTTAQEAELKARTAKLRSDLEAAKNAAEYETDLQEMLQTQLAEREVRSSELHRQLLDRELEQQEFSADVANLREDIDRLSKDLVWFQQDRQNDAGQLAVLVAEVRKAERSLANETGALRVAHIGRLLATSDLESKCRAERAVEARESTMAEAAAAAVQQLEARRTALRLELMQEEHTSMAIQNHLNSMQQKIGQLHGRKNY